MRKFIEKIKIRNHEGVVENNMLGKTIKSNNEAPYKYKVKGYDFPVVAGLISNRELLAASLGIKKDELIKFITDKVNSPKEYTFVKDAPFLANKIEANAKTPVEKYLPVIDFYGGKKYTSSSIVAVNFPGEDRLNLSFHRMMHLGGNRFSIRVIPQRHLDRSYMDAMEKGKDLQVAVFFGVHPAVEIAAAFSAPGLDELKLASSMLGGLNAFKLPNGVGVPADAEFVLEGRITKEMAEEGPFIDLTGTADPVRKQPVLEVDRIYFRKDPIFRTLLPGGNEHRMLMGVPQEPRLFKDISNTVPTVKNVVLSTGGSCWLHGVVQIKKRTDGDGMNTILAALAAHPSMKRVVVVDEDIDITNPDEVEWAIATRVQPDKQILIVPHAKGSSLDPSTNKTGITAKWGIDATKPLENNESYKKVEF